MARKFSPMGLHGGHVVIDGGIAGEHLLSHRPERAAEAGADGLLEIAAMAETFWQIHCQPRSAWTREIDLRPFREQL